MKRLVAQLTVLIAVSVMAVPASADDALIAKQIISKINKKKQAANLKGFDLGVQVQPAPAVVARRKRLDELQQVIPRLTAAPSAGFA